jgi:uncharacterized membrane protein
MANVATARVTPFSPTPPNQAVQSEGVGRISSLDLVRGVVMVLMAIDHVRVYSGVPAGGPTPGIFFTRWITHFVAPAFAFLAGTSIYLHARKLDNARATSRFLLTRGIWLVLLELTVVRVAWTFNLDFAHYMLAGVIWMLGWCMILMAALVHLSVRVNAVIGGAVVALHNLMDYAPNLQQSLGGGSWSGFWKLMYFGGVVQPIEKGPPLFVLYVIVPWIGVMALGYAFGALMVKPSTERERVLWRLGIAVSVAFVVLRALDMYGDPRHWTVVSPVGPRAPAAIRFLNTSKYPASLQFLLMTLGPMLLLLAAVDHARGRIANMFVTFGRVPFFFYLLHIPLIHAAACVVSLIREGRVDPWLFTNHPMNPAELPNGYMWSLPLLYLVFAICVAILYVPCRWYARIRATGKYRLLSYL